MDQKAHWEQVYASKPAEKLGWYEPHLRISLDWIDELHLPVDASILDVGGGASTLTEDLLDRGYRSITVIDLSARALSAAQERLAARAPLVTWLEADITAIELPNHCYDLWHDRAAFHFLTEPEQRQKYRANLLRALRPGGYLIVGAFALEAPPTCSGLPVQHYDSAKLQDFLGPTLELQRDIKESHLTPGGVQQMYLYCRFRRRS